MRRWIIRIVFGFLIGYFSYRYPIQWDLTNHKINSLSQSSLDVLAEVKKPVTIELFTANRAIEQHIAAIVELFQEENRAVSLVIHHDAIIPEEKSKLLLKTNDNVVISYDNQKKAMDVSLTSFNERLLADTIFQMLPENERWIVFLSGHGEPDPFSQDNQGLSLLTTELKEKGFKMVVLNLAEMDMLPDNATLLVIADPKTAWLPKETAQILTYVKKGGNLLCLINQPQQENIKPLFKSIGVEPLAGTIVDPKSHALGTPNPAISVITQYPKSPLGEAFNKITVFPWSTALQFQEATRLGWEVVPFLVTNPSTFIEKNQNKTEGPFTIGVSLVKEKQRLVVIGNSHFLSNTTIHNYGNLALANRIFNWLTTDESMPINFPAKIQQAQNFSINNSYLTNILIRYFFPYGLPMGYLAISWYTRRRRVMASSNR